MTYGAFKPDQTGNEYHDLDKIDADFAQMAAAGINTVRIPHTMPPRALLDIAERHGLRVMVGLSAEQYVGYLVDREKKGPDVAALVRAKVRTVAKGAIKGQGSYRFPIGLSRGVTSCRFYAMSSYATDHRDTGCAGRRTGLGSRAH